MYSFSSNTEKTKYENILSGSYKVETRYYIDSVEYTKGNVLSASINGGLYDNVSIGNAYVRTLEFAMRNVDSNDIAKGAEIIVEQRVSNSSASSEWIRKGVFYLANRVVDGIRLTLTAYDKLYGADIPFFPSGTWVSTTALNVVKNMICVDLGLTLASVTESLLTRTTVNIPFVPAMGTNSTTQREMLEYIATAYGGNWGINDAGELQLYLLNSLDTAHAIDAGLNCKGLRFAKPLPAIDRVIVSSGGADYKYPNVSTNVWDAMTGTILTAMSPYATADLAQAIYNSVHGFIYQGFEAKTTFVGPAVQLGDTLCVDGVYSIIASQVINISNKSPHDLETTILPEETEDEYRYSTPTEREIARSEARTQASIEVLQGEIDLKVSTSDFEAAEASNYASITPYYLQNYGATPSKTDPNWSTTAPQWVSGMHMWTLTEYVTKGGLTTRSNPVDITGATGASGGSGRGVTTVDNYYQVSSNGSTAPSTWVKNSVPPMTPTNRFLWGYEVTTYTDGTTDTTDPHVIGVYGEQGATGQQGPAGATGATGEDGVGIASITEYYGRSQAANTQPSSWSTTLTNVDSTWKFLWNYEYVLYTDNTHYESAKRIIGTYGDAGAAGKSPTAFEQYYYISSSDETQVDGEWVRADEFTLDNYQEGYYIWTKTVITWDDSTTTETAPYIDTYYSNTISELNILDGKVEVVVGNTKVVTDALYGEDGTGGGLIDQVDENSQWIANEEPILQSMQTSITTTAAGVSTVTTIVNRLDEYVTEQNNYMKWHGSASVPFLEIGTSENDIHTEMRQNAFAVVSGDANDANKVDVFKADVNGAYAREFVATSALQAGNFRWVDEGNLGFSLT